MPKIPLDVTSVPPVRVIESAFAGLLKTNRQTTTQSSARNIGLLLREREVYCVIVGLVNAKVQ